MSAFVVIDLEAQAEAVARYTQGWSRERFLRWLAQYGCVVKLEERYGDNRFAFRSHFGFVTSVRFTEKGELGMIGARTVERSA